MSLYDPSLSPSFALPPLARVVLPPSRSLRVLRSLNRGLMRPILGLLRPCSLGEAEDIRGTESPELGVSLPDPEQGVDEGDLMDIDRTL